MRDELAGHLKILERRGLISAWHDRRIVPGQAIDQHLTTADLVLLLVSKDFIGSDYIWGVELAQAMQRQQARQCEVMPIIVRALDIDPADADDLPFLKLQALPPDLKPVTSWPNRDEAWTQVAKGLRATVSLIRPRRPSAGLFPSLWHLPCWPACKSAWPGSPPSDPSMALIITDTSGGNRQRMRCPAARARGLQAEGEFVEEQEGLWRS